MNSLVGSLIVTVLFSYVTACVWYVSLLLFYEWRDRRDAKKPFPPLHKIYKEEDSDVR
jgi:hypothetical protein